MFALGDVHGDLETAKRLLAAAGLIDGAGKWLAKEDTLLVQMGDLINKAPKTDSPTPSVDCVKFFIDLHLQTHGRVICLMGNHEAEFLANPASKKAAEFAAEFAKLSQPEQRDLHAFLARMPLAVKVNRHILCHSGDVLHTDITKLGERVNFASILSDRGIVNARVHDKGAQGKVNKSIPWWSCDDQGRLHERSGKKRKNTRKSFQIGLDRLSSKLASLGADSVVMGHQPSAVRIPNTDNDDMTTLREKFEIGTIPNNGKPLIRLIDCGLSRGINENPTKAMVRIAPDWDVIQV